MALFFFYFSGFKLWVEWFYFLGSVLAWSVTLCWNAHAMNKMSIMNLRLNMVWSVNRAIILLIISTWKNIRFAVSWSSLSELVVLINTGFCMISISTDCVFGYAKVSFSDNFIFITYAELVESMRHIWLEVYCCLQQFHNCFILLVKLNIKTLAKNDLVIFWNKARGITLVNLSVLSWTPCTLYKFICC